MRDCTHPCPGAAGGEVKQPFADVGGHVRLDVIHHPAKSADQRNRIDPLEIICRLRPIETAARRRKNGGSLSHTPSQCRTVDAVDGRLFSIGHHDFVAEDVNRSESEKLPSLGIDDPHPSLPDLPPPQTRRRDENDQPAILCC